MNKVSARNCFKITSTTLNVIWSLSKLFGWKPVLLFWVIVVVFMGVQNQQEGGRNEQIYKGMDTNISRICPSMIL